MVWRVIAAGVSAVVAAASGVIAAVAAVRPDLGLWVGLGVLAAVGAGLQMLITAGERAGQRRVVASGAGAVAVGGSAKGIRVRVRAEQQPEGVAGEDGVIAAGPGAVSVGGDAAGPVSTDVTNAEG